MSPPREPIWMAKSCQTSGGYVRLLGFSVLGTVQAAIDGDPTQFSVTRHVVAGRHNLGLRMTPDEARALARELELAAEEVDCAADAATEPQGAA